MPSRLADDWSVHHSVAPHWRLMNSCSVANSAVLAQSSGSWSLSQASFVIEKTVPSGSPVIS
jgi:hypothetical protein